MSARAGTGLVLVAGLGRCGSSLLMQMLDAGGYPIVPGHGGAPGYEHPANVGRGQLPPGASGALKWLDPQRLAPPPKAEVRGSILLLRDNREQSRSHIKFLSALGFDTRGATVRQHAASLRQDEPRARRELVARGSLYVVQFEELIARPRTALAALRSWIGSDLDIEGAASVVRERETGSGCLPYLLEERLLAEQMTAERGRPC